MAGLYVNVCMYVFHFTTNTVYLKTKNIALKTEMLSVANKIVLNE